MVMIATIRPPTTADDHQSLDGRRVVRLIEPPPRIDRGNYRQREQHRGLVDRAAHRHALPGDVGNPLDAGVLEDGISGTHGVSALRGVVLPTAANDYSSPCRSPTHTQALVRSGVASGCIEGLIGVFTRLVISALALSALAVMEPAASAEPVPNDHAQGRTRKGRERLSMEAHRGARPRARAPDQVLVHVRAVSLNRGDLEMLAPRCGRRPGLVRRVGRRG